MYSNFSREKSYQIDYFRHTQQNKTQVTLGKHEFLKIVWVLEGKCAMQSLTTSTVPCKEESRNIFHCDYFRIAY